MDFLKTDREFDCLLGGKFLHVRCCAHVLNLSVQEGIVHLSPLLDPIRTVIRWIRRPRKEVRRRYKQLCTQHGLPKKKWPLDTPTRWNSTFTLLRSAIRYRDVITQLYNESLQGSDMITDDQWDLAIEVCDILRAYDQATNIFSYVYQPNVHLIILECVKVINAINQHAQTGALRQVLASMKAKWLEYYTTFPCIYCIAIILDPAVKLDGLRNLLTFYYDSLGKSFDSDSYIDECRATLEELHDFYAAQTNISSTFSSRVPESMASRFDPFIADIIFKRQKTGGASSSSTSSNSEVNEYLSHHFETEYKFDILEWWKSKQHAFPILARIAKDILAIPASTVASESAFSAGRRVLDEKRSRLAPENIEMCVCKKDWDQADRRTQGLKQEDGDEDDPWMMMDTGSSNPSTNPSPGVAQGAQAEETDVDDLD